MFGMGWSELLIIGVVALIVVGPQELPGLFRKMGQFTGKARAMAREFSRAMDAAADQAGVKEIKKTVEAAANPNALAYDKFREQAGLKSPDPDKADKPAIKPGSETEKLSKERQEAKDRMLEAAAKKANDRKAREAEAAAAAESAPEPAPAETDTPKTEASK
ncbi:Sec-independent protein translocase protein TatB [Marivivens marinus]|uniref:Sec-independent protein translocase protein TatB n=1 Tax=Marivivens marinus TaxID=3110173 RepID=UPI003B845848